MPPCRGFTKGKPGKGRGMDNDITFEQIVAVDDVLKRWHKKAAFLNELAETHIISLYVLNDSRVRPTDGKPVYFCSQVSSIYCYDYSSEAYDTDNIFLRPEEVAAYEKAHPEILWEPAHPEEAIMREYGENIPADVVRQWLKMSPMQFVDFMNSGVGPVTSLEEDFRRFRDNCGYKYADYTPFFTKEILKENCVIHILDWEDWRQEHPNMVHETPVRESALAAKDEELEQARAELAVLREENAVLKAELEKARQEKGQDAPKWYGLIAVVEQCRSEGKTPQETAVELKARGASYAIIGGLLHPEGDISDWTQYGSNIVEGNTKKLAW